MYTVPELKVGQKVGATKGRSVEQVTIIGKSKYSMMFSPWWEVKTSKGKVEHIYYNQMMGEWEVKTKEYAMD